MNNPAERLKFKNEILSQEKLSLAKELIDRYPSFLDNASSQSFGCPDCGDEGAIYIEKKENQKIKKFQIQLDTAKLPNEIKNYISDLKSIHDQILKN